MIKKILLFLLVIKLGLSCTNLLVTPKASKDSGVILAYLADAMPLYGKMMSYPAKDYYSGDFLEIYNWDDASYMGQIP